MMYFGIGFRTFVEWVVGASIVSFILGSGLTLYFTRKRKKVN